MLTIICLSLLKILGLPDLIFQSGFCEQVCCARAQASPPGLARSVFFWWQWWWWWSPPGLARSLLLVTMMIMVMILWLLVWLWWLQSWIKCCYPAIFFILTMTDFYWPRDRESEWFLRTCSFKLWRVRKVFPQILQGMQMLEMWCNSIWFMMRIICPSLPHSVHIRALALFIIFSLKVIIDFTFLSSSSRSNELLRTMVVSVAELVLISFFDFCVEGLCFGVGWTVLVLFCPRDEEQNEVFSGGHSSASSCVLRPLSLSSPAIARKVSRFSW